MTLQSRSLRARRDLDRERLLRELGLDAASQRRANLVQAALMIGFMAFVILAVIGRAMTALHYQDMQGSDQPHVRTACPPG